MLQQMLHERFKLALHHETRQMPVYQLVVAKDGPTLRPYRKDVTGEAASGSAGSNPVIDRDGFPVGQTQTMTVMTNGRPHMQALQRPGLSIALPFSFRKPRGRDVHGPWKGYRWLCWADVLQIARR
jgi:uncharacterized protein (TIGR03435 family)